LLYEFSQAVFARDREREYVLLLRRVELDRAGEALLGAGEVVVLDLARALEVGVVGLARLLRAHGVSSSIGGGEGRCRRTRRQSVRGRGGGGVRGVGSRGLRQRGRAEQQRRDAGSEASAM